MAVLDEIRERIDLLDLIGARTPLRKLGKNFKGLCPFHSEKTPSFVVYPESWHYHCFGCGAHGSGIDFLMATQNLDFRDALAELAGRAGIALETVRREADPEVEHARQRLREALEMAARFFYNLLVTSPRGERARAYAAERQLDRRTIDAFQLGYSPDGWTDLSDYLRGEGVTDQEMIDAGLLVDRDDGRRYDRFRDRLMFPIRDADGRLVGFGARTLENAQPKYLNSPQTDLFDKSAVLYGIDRAKPAIRQAGQAVVVEGYMDVIALHQRGIENVVAAMGTSLTDRQIRILKRFSSNIVLALDADAAGAEATLRGLDVARGALDKKIVAEVDWRGAVRFEQTLNTAIRVAVLPAGQDPDDVAKSGVDHWRTLVDEARPILDYLLETVAARMSVDDPKAKSVAAERILPVIAEIREPIERDLYRGRLAQLLGLTERDVNRAMRKLKAPAAAEPAPPVRDGPLSPEQYCLALLINTPELVSLIDETGLIADDFRDPRLRRIFTNWQQSGPGIPPDAVDESLESSYSKLVGFQIPNDGLASRQVAFRDVVANLQRIRREASVPTLSGIPSPEAVAAQAAEAILHNRQLRALKDRRRVSRSS